MSNFLPQLSLLVVFIFQITRAEREHKVHNIVLYPEKYSWCQTTAIQQIVASPGYEPVTIKNNVCVGACYSYSIPKTEPAEPGEVIGPYCDSCQPAKIKCYHVNLKSEKNSSQIMKKRVEIIQDCACASCDKIRREDCEITDKNTLELPADLFNEEESNTKKIMEEVPELLNRVPSELRNKSSETKIDAKFKTKAENWFKTIEKLENENFTKTRLNELFDLERGEENNAKIEQDLVGKPATFGLEGVPSNSKGSHIAMGLTPNIETVNVPPKPGHIHHHVLGEIQVENGQLEHLVKGPHGSMVLEPIEKFNIDTDSLKPNDEGLVISYENHHKNPINNLD